MFRVCLCKLRYSAFAFLNQAKPETVKKASCIVKKQLALADETQVTGETKFSELGADSLDTVSIIFNAITVTEVLTEQKLMLLCTL